jgi:hypothetical protein
VVTKMDVEKGEIIIRPLDQWQWNFTY